MIALPLFTFKAYMYIVLKLFRCSIVVLIYECGRIENIAKLWEGRGVEGGEGGKGDSLN